MPVDQRIAVLDEGPLAVCRRTRHEQPAVGNLCLVLWSVVAVVGRVDARIVTGGNLISSGNVKDGLRNRSLPNLLGVDPVFLVGLIVTHGS